jgi:hypothetical protein
MTLDDQDIQRLMALWFHSEMRIADRIVNTIDRYSARRYTEQVNELAVRVKKADKELAALRKRFRTLNTKYQRLRKKAA